MGRMSLLSSRNGLALLCVLLTACASSTPAVHDGYETAEAVSSWEEARADPSCVVPLCDEERCAIWRCRDVVQVAAPAEVEASPVVLAKGVPAVRPAPAFRPAPTLRPPSDAQVATELRSPLEDSPNRWWGHPVAAPTVADPVFEIPWHNWKTREARVAKALRHWQCNLPPKEPYEKHHIFPQQERLARWFDRQGIDIHAFTIRVPRSFHQWLHSGGPDGGQWNEAWRQFQDDNPRATAAQMWAFAGELMSRFGVNGPLVPYYCD
jgi:uncharacterized lipoprotein (TIGR02269 family)